MKKISRKLALTHLAIIKITQCSEEDVDNIISAEYLNEDGESIEYSDIFDDSIQEFLLNYFIDVKLKGFINEYLQGYLEGLYKEPFSVVGKEDDLEECPCCGYLTLPSRGDYDVCSVCYWEDDGKPSSELDSYSSVNHSTLREYREKFEEKNAELNNIPYKLGRNA
ncbi:CPCC family cysteine-rich protein [Serratia fonticola]|uniref:CPCC family cysteine-rich protein n=1 Tax=Serratia fonticola TaxID=47917 RepID=UPI0034C67A09